MSKWMQVDSFREIRVKTKASFHRFNLVRQTMRPDAHKAKASVKWKLKHGQPTQSTAKGPTGSRRSKRPLPSNSFRFEQQDIGEQGGSASWVS